MAEHTPGPWHILPRGGFETVYGRWVGPAESGGVAFVNGDLPEAEGNAALVAAAPDLLAALERLTRGTVDSKGFCSVLSHAADCAYCAARAAIAKARGEAQA